MLVIYICNYMYVYMKIYNNNNYHQREYNLLKSYWKRIREGIWRDWTYIKEKGK